MDSLEDVLEHHGIPGMKWGHRKRRESTSSGPVEIRVKQVPGKFVKTAGGKGHPAHPDALEAAKHRQKAKRSTTDALSTKELQTLVSRMNLEVQYSNLKKKSDRSPAAVRFIKGFLGNKQAMKAATDFAKSENGQAIKNTVGKKSKKVAKKGAGIAAGIIAKRAFKTAAKAAV